MAPNKKTSYKNDLSVLDDNSALPITFLQLPLIHRVFQNDNRSSTINVGMTH